MSHREYLDWLDFYALQPFDDFHRFHRPAALVASSMWGGSIQERLDFLQPPPPPPEFVGYSSADASVFLALGLKPPTA